MVRMRKEGGGGGGGVAAAAVEPHTTNPASKRDPHTESAI